MGLIRKLIAFFGKAEEKIGIIREFRLYTLIIMLIIGWLIINSLSNYTKKDAIGHLGESAFVFGKSISHHLENKDLSKPLSGSDLRDLDEFVKKQLLANKDKSNSDILLGLTIYNKKGAPTYNSQDGIKESGDHREYVKQALEGKIVSKKSDLSIRSEKMRLLPLLKRTNLTELAEVHAPLYLNEQRPVAVVKMYLDTTIANRYIARSFQIVVLIVIMGLIFLYFSLSWFFYRAHRKITKKNEELNRLTDKVMTSLKELEESYLGTMQALTMAVDAKDHYTAGHSFRVASFAKEIGRVLGFTEEALENLEKGARFHDIGKIGVKENVLNKHGSLSPQEFREMQRHTLIGAKIIEPVKSLHSIIPIIRSHHERMDGKGYPDGLKFESISMEARIVAVADCFDAMTTDRPNRRAFPASKAIEIIKEESGKHFDKEVVEAFLKAYSGQQMLVKRELTTKDHKMSA